MMKELILTPEEVFFLGKKMDGEYLDYRYIQAMGDISQRKAVLRQECIDSLSEKKIVSENLLGDVEVDPEAVAFMKPVYFSSFESAVQIYRGEEQIGVQTYLLHRGGPDTFVLSYQKADGTFHFQVFNGEDVLRFLVSFVSDEYLEQEETEEGVAISGKIEQILTVESFEIENDVDDDMEPEEMVLKLDAKQNHKLESYYCHGGRLYQEVDDKTMEEVLPEKYLTEAYELLTGGRLNGIS